jgi:hypothetical protein
VGYFCRLKVAIGLTEKWKLSNGKINKKLGQLEVFTAKKFP